MKDNTQVFESYSVPRAVRTLALPSMMGMLVNIVYNLADTFFVVRPATPIWWPPYR